MGGWLGGFVNAGLVAGTALAAVPIVIHLLNRQRHRPMPWAAMRFVIAAHRRTRRRVQIENLILLLLRVAGIALLALAVARPFAGERSPFAALTERRRDVALVIDASASTGYREGVQVVFEREVARAREIVRKLDGTRGDRARVILAGAWPRLVSWSSPNEALAVLDAASAPTDEGMDLAAALGEVLKLAREEASGPAAGELEVRLLTDLQRRSFVPREPETGSASKPVSSADPKSRPVLLEQLDELQKLGLKVLVEDLGPSDSTPPNLGIASVAPATPVLGPGILSDIGVEIRNHGASARSGVRVTIKVDGESRPSETVDVPARGRAEATFPVVFGTAGEHWIEARLEGDRLAIDDSRVEVVVVPPQIRVLLVDGAPGATIEEDETGYLRMVLEPPVDDAPGDAGRRGALGAEAAFEPREVRPELLATGEVDLEKYDVIWLANVGSLSAPVVEKLERAVAGGAALIASLGDQVVPESWNARLYRADGTGLLPAEIGKTLAVASRRESYYRVKTFDVDNPALSFFADERWKPLLTEVPVYAFVAVRPLPGARVLATLDDEGAHPLLVERAYDRGRVLVWTTSIDTAWTRLPESPRTLVPLVHELLRYAARAPAPPCNVAPGEPLRAEVPAFPRNPVLVRPDGARRPLDGEARPQAGGRWTLPVPIGRDTETAGLYRIEWEGAPDTKRKDALFAVRIDAAEGDLARLAASELSSLHPALVQAATGERNASGDGSGGAVRGELWRGIAIACLVALVLESLWAAWLGRRRSV